MRFLCHYIFPRLHGLLPYVSFEYHFTAYSNFLFRNHSIFNFQDKIAVANPRYRRSQSADRWVDHRPGALVPVETILQPLMRRRRSITRLTSPKEITEGASRYCLIAQEHDSAGELETKLYKVCI